jgi:hypothetical protein
VKENIALSVIGGSPGCCCPSTIGASVLPAPPPLSHIRKDGFGVASMVLNIELRAYRSQQVRYTIQLS